MWTLGRNFFLLWQGQLLSQLGNQAFLIAAAFFTLDKTGSATLVGIVMMASTIPIALIGPVGGTIADRHSRRSILITTDILRAVAVGALAGLIAWWPTATTAHVVALVATSFFSGSMGALFRPAVQAAIPDLVPVDRLAAANSLNQISLHAAALAGQAVGGLLYAALGAAALLFFDALTFLYGAVATAFIPPDPRRRRENRRLLAAIREYAIETGEGLSYLREHRGMTAVLVLFAGVNFLFMPVFVLLPLYVREVLGAGTQWYGFLMAGSGAGALTASVTAGLMLRRVRSMRRLIGGCVLGIAGALLVVAMTPSVWPALTAFVAIGAFSAVVNIAVITAFQTSVPAAVRGRVMALVVSVSALAVPIGMALGGVIGDIWRSSLRVVIAGCAVSIAALLGVGQLAREPRITDSDRH
ncbi:MAG TPA: MFS transporter [Thermoanaerobaculia bacterium]|nr:MFS transporter [Thermoanaerobaculia bacterium]